MNTKSSKIHHKSYDVSTLQFSEIKVRKLTRLCGFSGYSIYRYLVNETFCKGAFLLLWNKKTAQDVAAYWNATPNEITKIVNGCIQVGLFNDELYRKHGVLTSADIQQDYIRCFGMGAIPKEFELLAS